MASALTYEDGLNFVCAFDDAFPGRAPNPNHKNASARLRRFLKRLSDDGRHQIDRDGEPTTQYVHALPRWLICDLKTGKETPESAAKTWSGYDPLPLPLDLDQKGAKAR